jgi:hypothetical protein
VAMFSICLVDMPISCEVLAGFGFNAMNGEQN